MRTFCIWRLNKIFNVEIGVKVPAILQKKHNVPVEQKKLFRKLYKKISLKKQKKPFLEDLGSNFVILAAANIQERCFHDSL
jgi:hypothetical protein